MAEGADHVLCSYKAGGCSGFSSGAGGVRGDLSLALGASFFMPCVAFLRVLSPA